MNSATTSKAKWLLAAVLLLSAAAWLDSRQMLPAGRQALALENPIEDRKEMIGLLQGVNARLDRLISLLESGKVKMVVGNAEELKGALAVPAARDGGAKPDVVEPKIVIKRKGEPAAE